MRVGIIDADLMDNGTRHPNLALMKISGFYKSTGNEVKLIYHSYDEIREYESVFISKVFNFTKVPDWVLKERNVNIGGTGFFEDGGINLPDEIEHHMPDYNLYNKYIEDMVVGGKKTNYFEDYLEYSIGFLTRGCFRKCSFCVNKKYDHVFRHSPIEEFLDESRPKIYLWDDNFLAYSKWEECLDSLEMTGKPFQFRQGIDIRLMDDRKAYRFNNTKWCGDFIFAFDHLKDKNVICRNIQLWKKYTNKQPKLYVLSGFNSQDAEDIADVFERISLLMRYGCIPYIMRYEEYRNSKYRGMYIQIARWCNQPQFYKKMSFREFCERNQFYHPNKDTYCSAYRAMVEFENDYPEIAQKYFDLKYMYENIYEVNYGTGHRYHNKPECKMCKSQHMSWDEILEGNVDKEKIIQLYLEREIELRCVCYKNSECLNNIDRYAEFIINILVSSSYQECENAVAEYIEKHKLNVEECIVPNKNIHDIEKYLIAILKFSKNGVLNINDLFVELNLNTNKEKANGKHMLLNLTLLDLIYYSKNSRNPVVSVSNLGNRFMKLSLDNKERLFEKLILRFPIIQKYYQSGKSYELTIEGLKLSKKLASEIKSFLKNNGKKQNINKVK